METQVVVKNIKYNFNDKNDEMAEIARSLADNTTKEWYEEEQELQLAEYEELLSDNEVSSFEEYKQFIGLGIDGTDYRKPYEENRERPEVQDRLREYTQRYMQNAYDLPKNVVITLDDSVFDEKGVPDEYAVTSAIQKEYGVQVFDYAYADKAEKKDILSQDAYNKIGEMIDSKDFQSYLDLRASIGKYSSNNITMIYLQKPDAKAVMGFHAWKDYDRHIEAGQSAISIWQPMIRQLKTEKQVDRYIAERSVYYGEPTSSKAREAKEKMLEEIEKNGYIEKDFGYKLGPVFDVSQTVPFDKDHDTLSQIVNLEKPLDSDLANFEEVVRSMKNAATLSHLSIVTSGVSEQDALFNSLVKYADDVLGKNPEKISGIKSPQIFKGNMHEIESIMTAYLICSHIGIDSGDKAGFKLAEIFDKGKNAEDLVKYGKREMFTEPFDRACKLSDMFIKDFDKDFGYSIEEQRNAVKQAVKEKQEAFRLERKNNSPKIKRSKTDIDRD